MLKSFVEIKFQICSIYKAQCAEENSPLKFTEQFCKMLIAQSSLRSSLQIRYRDLEHANDASCAISTFENTGTKCTCRIVSSCNFTELCSKFFWNIWAHHTVKAVVTFIKLSFISASPELVLSNLMNYFFQYTHYQRKYWTCFSSILCVGSLWSIRKAYSWNFTIFFLIFGEFLLVEAFFIPNSNSWSEKVMELDKNIHSTVL